MDELYFNSNRAVMKLHLPLSSEVPICSFVSWLNTEYLWSTSGIEIGIRISLDIGIWSSDVIGLRSSFEIGFLKGKLDKLGPIVGGLKNGW